MLTIDGRAGSGELLGMFPPGMDVSLGHLDFGDFMFLGNGPENSLITVGVERKSIKDLLNSIVTGRLSGHQIPGMLGQYDYSYVLVEGIWRYSPESGTLQTLNGSQWVDLSFGQRRFMAKEVTNFLNTMAVKTGIHVVYSDTRKETVQVVCSLYHWWNSKQWDQHSSHLSPNKAHKGPQGEVAILRPTLVRRVAAEMKGIGWGKSKLVESYFPSLIRMVNATEREWRNVPGIGKGIARDVVEEIRKENHQNDRGEI